MTDYVNQGPDPRIFGRWGGRLQTRLSFRSPTPPQHVAGKTAGRFQWLVTLSRPRRLPFVSIAIPTTAGRWATFRAGWRYDANWGDKTPCGVCPVCLAQRPWGCERQTINPPPYGGYIADIIIKLNFDRIVHYGVLCALTLGLAACSAKQVPTQVVRVVETVEVKVPTPVARTPPAELLIKIAAPLPVFVAPEQAEASSALTAEGERLLRALIEDLLTRIAAWETWARSEEQ